MGSRRYRTLETISDQRRQRLEEVLKRRQPSLRIIIENVWDPHNVSAILRSADAVGVQTVHLLYTVEDPPDLGKAGKQSSASARKWLNFRLHRDAEECFSVLREDGFKIYASHLTRNSIMLGDIDFTDKVAIVIGNESRGVSEESCALSDGIYFIPMMGMVESLNVSVASAVSLYEALRQRTAAGMYDEMQLSDAEFTEKLESWGRK